MLHVTCDLCGKELCPGHDQRFVVKVEVFAAHEPAKITEADLDDDHMEAVSELLREMEENEPSSAQCGTVVVGDSWQIAKRPWTLRNLSGSSTP